MWECKHCHQQFDFSSTSEKANHSRWCDQNPKATKYREENISRGKQRADEKLGPLKTYAVACSTCTKEFDVEERESLHPMKENYYCSKSCSNSVGGTAKARKHHPDSIAHYTVVANRHHEKECVVCGFRKIVEVHHIDENRNNNDPKNLIFLCPNHHRMFHSRFRLEIEPFINNYVVDKWDEVS